MNKKKRKADTLLPTPPLSLKYDNTLHGEKKMKNNNNIYMVIVVLLPFAYVCIHDVTMLYLSPLQARWRHLHHLPWSIRIRPPILMNQSSEGICFG